MSCQNGCPASARRIANLQGFSATIVYNFSKVLLVNTIGGKTIKQMLRFVNMSININIDNLVAPLLGRAVLDIVGYYSAFTLYNFWFY